MVSTSGLSICPKTDAHTQITILRICAALLHKSYQMLMMISRTRQSRYNDKLISRNGYINIFKLCALAPFTTIKSLLLLTLFTLPLLILIVSLLIQLHARSLTLLLLLSFQLPSSQLSFRALFRHLLSWRCFICFWLFSSCRCTDYITHTF